MLILDEPTDGLDPNQKHEMRQLIKEMGKSKAIIVSTHILEEVEAICTRVAIIDQGRLVFNGSPAEMLAQSPQAGRVSVNILGQNSNEVREALQKLPGISEIRICEQTSAGTRALIEAKKKTGLATVVKTWLDSQNWDFNELHTETGRLDEVFHRITSLDSAREVRK